MPLFGKMLRELAGSNIKVTAMGYSWNGILYTYMIFIYIYTYIHSLNQFDV